MRNSRNIPIVTIAIALVITVIQILRSLGGRYDEFIITNFDWVNWEVFYTHPWRLLTSSFIHHNLFHYFANLFWLCLFGWMIEPNYGSAKTLGILLGAMVAGPVLNITVAHVWTIGFSDGVCGLFGFSLIVNRRVPWWTTLTHRPIHAFFIAALAMPFLPFFSHLVGFGTAHLAHLGGILYGLAFGITFLLLPRETKWRWVVIALPFVLFASQFYSLWQLEWRLVNRPPTLLTSNADCRLKSIEPDVYTSANLTVVNASTKRIALYWMDYEGKPRAYFWLRPGSSDEYYPFIGHRWCIVDVDSHEALQAITVTEPEQTITFH